VTDLRMALLELLSKYKDDVQLDALREGVELLTQALMEPEVSEEIGTERYQRTDARKTHRNGYRKRRWDTRVGTVQLKTPKLRKAATSPACLSPGGGRSGPCFRRCRRPMCRGVSIRKVDELVKSLGLEGAQRTRYPGSARSWTRWWSDSATAPSPRSTPRQWLDAGIPA